MNNSSGGRPMDNFLSELKMARENAILGNYLNSVTKYRSAINMVQTYLQSMGPEATSR